MNKEFKNMFIEKGSSIFDDMEYYPFSEGESKGGGEFIVQYKSLTFSVQHYIWDNVLHIDSSLTSVKYRGRDLQPCPIDWEYSERSTNYSIEQLVDNLICELTSCNAKTTLRNVVTTISSIKEDLTEEEFELFKVLLDTYDN